MSMKQMLNDWLPFLIQEAALGSPNACGILGWMYREGYWWGLKIGVV